MAEQLTREEQFLTDYAQLKAWCAQRELEIANHTSLERIANRMTPTNWPVIVAGIGGLKTTEQILGLSARHVAAMVGSQFGLGITADKFSNPKGIGLLAVASMSLLSGCYVGIHLYRIENGAIKTYGVKFEKGQTVISGVDDAASSGNSSSG